MKRRLLHEKNSCLHSALIYDDVTGEKICKKCGQVLAWNTVDYSSDVFTNNFESMRTGPKISMTIHDGGLSTTIGKSNYDSSGNPIAYKLKGSMNRMRMWDSRSKFRSTANRNLVIALLEMAKLKEKMGLSDAILERSAYFYRKALEKKLIRGRTIKGVVGACVYAACRDLGTTRTIIEISKHLQERRNVIAKCYRLLYQKLILDVSMIDPTSSIIRFSNNLNLSEKLKRDALSIFNILKEKQVVAGKKPNAVAATAIYMAAIRTNENISQHKIAEISGVSGVTIRNRFKEYRKYVALV